MYNVCISYVIVGIHLRTAACEVYTNWKQLSKRGSKLLDYIAESERRLTKYDKHSSNDVMQ